MFNICTSKKKLVAIGLLATAVLFLIATLFLIFIKPYPVKYVDEIKQASQEFEIEPSLIASVVFAESRFNTQSKSNQGAIGLMQILPSTAEYLAKLMKIEYETEMLYEPSYNINMGTFYLRYLLQKFENKQTALASYNAGEGNVKLWLLSTKYSQDGKTIQTTPFAETNSYVEKILTAEKYYKKVFNRI